MDISTCGQSHILILAELFGKQHMSTDWDFTPPWQINYCYSKLPNSLPLYLKDFKHDSGGGCILYSSKWCNHKVRTTPLRVEVLHSNKKSITIGNNMQYSCGSHTVVRMPLVVPQVPPGGNSDYWKFLHRIQTMEKYGYSAIVANYSRINSVSLRNCLIVNCLFN